MKLLLTRDAKAHLARKQLNQLTLFLELISGGCGCGCCGTSGDFVWRHQLRLRTGKPTVDLTQSFLKQEADGITIYVDERLSAYEGDVELGLEKTLFTQQLAVIRPVAIALPEDT